MIAMPCALGGDRVGDLDRLAVDQDLAAGVGLVGARQDLHQRRLAGAVLAHQRLDLAAPGLELDVVERLHAREGLGDPAHLQRRRPRHLGHASSSPAPPRSPTATQHIAAGAEVQVQRQDRGPDRRRIAPDRAAHAGAAARALPARPAPAAAASRCDQLGRAPAAAGRRRDDRRHVEHAGRRTAAARPARRRSRPAIRPTSRDGRLEQAASSSLRLSTATPRPRRCRISALTEARVSRMSGAAVRARGRRQAATGRPASARDRRHCRGRRGDSRRPGRRRRRARRR